MSKDGAATGLIEQYLPAFAASHPEGVSIPIIASLWHTDIMDALIAGAERAAEKARTYLPVNAPLIRVPGSFELPVAAARLAAEKRPAEQLAAEHMPGEPLAAARLVGAHDGLVGIGVVIRGETPHFDYVCQAASSGLAQVALNSGKPVGFGLLTVDNEEQALDRIGGEGASEDKGYEAFEAAIVTIASLALRKS